jgi:isocitrate dehydrogenase (NAD+)
MPKGITLIPGDGIGPEVTAATVQLLKAAGADLEWEEVEAGEVAISKYGKPLPDQVLESVRMNKVALKGPLTTGVAKGFPSANVELRQRMETYASLRPVKNVPGIESRFGEVALVIVRENTEGLYSGLEHTITTGVTQSLKIITRKASTRIAHFAFEYAKKWNRKKVTTAHKANILKISDGLFLKTCHQVAQEYPDIRHEEMIVDNLAMQLVLRPENFDVLLLTNSLWRHRFRSVCGTGGRIGTCSGCQYRKGMRGLRSRSWECSGHCREKQSQSTGCFLQQSSHARASAHGGHGQENPTCHLQGNKRGHGADFRSGRQCINHGIH